jgi:succinoglycan biosynthesis protein ExoA
MNPRPSVSVLIPCRNEERTVGEVLDAFRAQTYPADRMEVVVADGFSTDATRARLADYARAHPEFSLRVVDNPGRTAPAGLNAGLRAARGEIILRMDAHAVPAPDYIEQTVEALARTGCDGVGGGIDIRPGGPGIVARAIAAAVGDPFATGGVRYRAGGAPGEVDTVPFAAFRREVFDRIGTFNEQVPVNEDYEFNYRVRAAGGRIWFSPTIRSRYIARSGWRALLRQYFFYGHQKAVMLSFHPKSLRVRQLVPALFAPSLLILGVGALFSAGLAFLLGVELLAYALAAGFFAFRAAAARKDPALGLVLPAVYFCIHGAWSAGFWVGAAKHPGRLLRGGAVS